MVRGDEEGLEMGDRRRLIKVRLFWHYALIESELRPMSSHLPQVSALMPSQYASTQAEGTRTAKSAAPRAPLIAPNLSLVLPFTAATTSNQQGFTWDIAWAGWVESEGARYDPVARYGERPRRLSLGQDNSNPFLQTSLHQLS